MACIVGQCNDSESTSLEQEQREKTIIYLMLMWQRLLEVFWMKILAQVPP
jgi:hypothetical protein